MKMPDEELHFHFRLLSILGMWTPSFENSIYYGIYYLWRAIIILLITLFFISQMVDLSGVNSIEGMTDNFLLTTPWFCCMLKVAALLVNHDEIVEMLNLLKLPFCTPKTLDEQNIINEYRHRAWLVWTRYLTFCSCILFLQLAKPVVAKNGIEERILPYSTWQPYGLENIVTYVLTYLCYNVTAIVSMPLNITMDCLISGLMIVTCSQMELLKCKLSRLQETPDDWKYCVEHHNVIIQFAKTITDIFGTVIFIQCILSMINICSIIFVVFKSETKTESIVSLFFLLLVTLQLLLHCWNGNEIIVKSQSVGKVAMNDTNWVTLPPQIQKALLNVIARSQNPVELKVGGMLTLSLNTFMMILKTSYTAYSMLRTMKT